MLKNIMIFSIVLLSSVWASSQTRIINGTEVSSLNTEWKTITALKWRGKAYCAGTLIAPTWVLTAAHCLVDSSNHVYTVASGDTVGIGSYNINTLVSYIPKRFIIHPSYTASTNDNDIGLVELQTAVTGISPIDYDTSHSLATNTQTKVAGWGNMSTSPYSFNNVFPSNLMEARVPIVSTSLCNSSFSYNGTITSNMICAGYMKSTKDSCQGDSGGPLIVNNTLVGIVSWGNGCARDNFPGVYTKIQNYKVWIESYVPYKVSKTAVLIPIITLLLGS